MASESLPANQNEASILAALTRYAERGLRILPVWGTTADGVCRCPRGNCGKNTGKHPCGRFVQNGVHDATLDPVVIADWVRRSGTGGNWAVATGHPLPDGGYLAVLDVDPRNNGDETLLDFIHAYGEPPVTPQVVTGGGGEHRYFRVPEPVGGRVLGDGLELKGAGGYVVVHPSLHMSGRRYEWELSRDLEGTPIAEAPSWIVTEKKAAPRPLWSGASARNSYLGEAFSAAGMLGVELRRGVYAVRCPWQEEHSDGRGDGTDSSTVLLPPTPESAFGMFKCAHAHCAERTWKDVIEILPPTAKAAAQRAHGPRAVPDTPPPPERVDVELAADQPDKKKKKVPRVAVEVRGALAPEKLAGVRDHLFYSLHADGSYRLRQDLVNAVEILLHDPRWKGVLAHDVFADQIVFMAPAPWHPNDEPAATGGKYPRLLLDSDLTLLTLWFIRYWGLHLPDNRVEDALVTVAKVCAFHPVRDHLNALDAWDGTPRLDTWAIDHCNVVDSSYARMVSRWWLLSAVARVFEPGVKVDHTIVLEGKQGIGKSTAMHIFGGPWYTGSHVDLDSKDGLGVIHGKWIVELQELDSLKRTEVSRVKAMLTTAEDRFRPPYGKFEVQKLRQCVFAGTVNELQYLTDVSGNRRFLPLYCGTKPFDLRGLRDHRDQILAEALARYRDRERFHPETDEEKALCAAEVQERLTSDPYDQPIHEWLEGHGAKDIVFARGFVMVADAMSQALHLDKGRWTRAEAMRVGESIRLAGWTRRRCSLSGMRVWGYEPAETKKAPSLSEESNGAEVHA